MKTNHTKSFMIHSIRSVFLAAWLMFVAVAVQAQSIPAPNNNDRAVLNLLTNQAGMHRIGYAELLAAGADLGGLKHNKFGLFSQGQWVPIRTKGQNKSAGAPNRFGPGGYIEFYAEATDNLYTNQRAYTLTYLDSNRIRMRSERAKPDNNVASVAEYTHTQKVEEERYYDYLAPSTNDPWHYGRLLARNGSDPSTEVDVELDNLVGNTAAMDVNVYGILDIPSDVNDHHIVASMNGAEVGDEQFDGNVPHTLSIAAVPVTDGVNQFKLNLRTTVENPFDAVGLNSLVVRYQRNAIAIENRLEGTFAGAQVKVAGFANNKIGVYRKEANGGMTRLTRIKKQNGEVSFKNNVVGAADYVVVADAGYHAPQVAMLPLQQDITSGDAEYLIITHPSFQGAALDTLVQLRSADYSVKVVEIEQIYAQFGDHVPTAAAIHDYVKYAVANLGTQFVTLIGSDTYDYKNNGNSNSVSFIPTKYAQTPGGQLFVRQTPSDASYGDVDDDGVPDVAVGRLSVRTQAELDTVLEKIQDYQAREGYSGRILIAADKADIGNGIEFSDDVDAMIDAIPNDWQGFIRDDFKAIPDVDGDQQARDKVLNAINAGVSVAAYIGHSSQEQWSRATPPLFKATDIAGLTNLDKPTMITQWGCWNTYFVDPSGNSMADQFLVGENGAVTVLGASTLTTSEGERALGIELNKRMYLQGKPIGQAVIEAKQALAVTDPGASDILLGWQIIGDPALVINP